VSYERSCELLEEWLAIPELELSEEVKKAQDEWLDNKYGEPGSCSVSS
jgi:hypothetical protein